MGTEWAWPLAPSHRTPVARTPRPPRPFARAALRALGAQVDSQGQPTTKCIDSGHSANDHRAAEKDVRVSLDLRSTGEKTVDRWLRMMAAGKENAQKTEMLATLRRHEFGDACECTEDLLAFEAAGGGAGAMGTSIAAWARFATHVGACTSEQACDPGAIRKALKASGHEGTYAVPATCDLVYNCDELKEALLRRGTPEVQKMFRPAAELRQRNISDAGDDGSPDDSCLRWCARAFDKYPGQREQDIIRACDACRKA
jgi:hypothetical protein